MEAPLGNVVRKLLTDKDASKKLMQQIIMGERINTGAGETIDIADKKIKIQRIASIDSHTDKKYRR